MSVVYLGKRKATSYQGSQPKRVYRADPAPVYLGTRSAAPARSWPTVRGGRYGAPYRTGGFYGASVRSPMEKKVVDTAYANYDVNATGSVTLISGCATGTDFTDRIGRRTNITAIQVRGSMKLQTDAQSEIPQVGRVMIVEDMQCNGVIASITDILKTAETTSFNNLNNRERFRVHHDQVFDFGIWSKTATQSYGMGNCCHHFEIYKRVNIPVVYEGTGATIGSISSGAIYLVFIGSTPAGTNDLYSGCSTRIRFIDA